MRFEALIGPGGLAQADDPDAYPFAVVVNRESGLACLDPSPMWRRLCQDLRSGILPTAIASRFHGGLVRAVADMACRLSGDAANRRFTTVALSGGCFQNRWLCEALVERLHAVGLGVLLHARVPTNDGGLALGQSAIAAARLIKR